MDEKLDPRTYDPKPRESGEVQEEIGALSSRVLEMTGIKGKVTDTGPLAGSCESGGADKKKYRMVTHPWSLYGVDNTVLEKGMDNLATELPKRGWEITKKGPDSSKNRNLEIKAVHGQTYTLMEAVWMKGLDGHEAMIAFNLYSRCFLDPKRAGSTPPASS
ncbi:hypothetical protein [Streptomyces sp. URMC 123]|uniref:hypothetical protein n=1 Tax=Streptomyces sp. URMC 123 TaxID=3423403 RepID=UPI003F1BC083